MIRAICEKWTAIIHNKNFFDSRKLELRNHDSRNYSGGLNNEDFFPKPERRSLKKAMVCSIEYFLKLRKQIEGEQNIKWKTKEKGIHKICSLIKKL